MTPPPAVPGFGRVLILVPRIIGLIGVLPLFLGLGWLTWDLASESMRLTREWRPVQLKVLDGSGASIRIEVSDPGGTRELELPKGDKFTGLQQGEELPGYQNPADGNAIVPGRGVDLWGGAAVLGFFCLFLGGAFVFLMSVRIGPPELPAWEEPASVEPRQDLSRFHRQPRFGSGLEEIVLRQAPRVWKAALFWACPGLIWAVAALAAGAGEDRWLQAFSVVAGLGWAALFAGRAAKNKSWELRFKQNRLSVKHCFGRREFQVEEVKLVTREAGHSGAYRLLDSQGSVLLKLDGDAGPPEALTRLLHRLSEQTGKPLAEH